MSTAYSSIEEAWGVTNLEDPTAGIVPKKIPIPRIQNVKSSKPKRTVTKRTSEPSVATAAGGSSDTSYRVRSPTFQQCSVSTIRAMVYDAYVNGGPHAVLDMLGPDVTKDIFGVYTSENEGIWTKGVHWIEDIPNDPNKIALVVAIIVLALLMFR